MRSLTGSRPGTTDSDGIPQLNTCRQLITKSQLSPHNLVSAFSGEDRVRFFGERSQILAGRLPKYESVHCFTF